jgi:hypothetical protein
VFGYNIAENAVDVHDLHATILHCLGVDHTRLTFKFQGRHFRLTDVHGNVVRGGGSRSEEVSSSHFLFPRSVPEIEKGTTDQWSPS